MSDLNGFVYFILSKEISMKTLTFPCDSGLGFHVFFFDYQMDYHLRHTLYLGLGVLSNIFFFYHYLGK